MRIAIDARKLHDFGIGTYIRNLLRQLASAMEGSAELAGVVDQVLVVDQGTNPLRDQPDLLGIYCVGAGRFGVARAMREIKHARKQLYICHHLTPLTRSYMIDELADVVIDQNARLTAEQSVIQLLGSIAS